jgi:hypothetical protein
VTRLRIENRTGYDTYDLVAFAKRGLVATGTRPRGGELRIVFSAAPRRSRGCASVSGSRMVLALGPPSYNETYEGFLRRLSRLLEHEAAHLRGIEHEEMDRRLLYSLGPIPDWARGTRIRYHGRAPSQLPFLRQA